MVLTMVKKIKSSGSACPQCDIAEYELKKRGVWEEIDHIVVADENDLQSEGYQLAVRHRVTSAPFFIVRDQWGGEAVFHSHHQLLTEHFKLDVQSAANSALPDRVADYV